MRYWNESRNRSKYVNNDNYCKWTKVTSKKTKINKWDFLSLFKWMDKYDLLDICIFWKYEIV